MLRNNKLPDFFRHFILAWLMAVTISILHLPFELRNPQYIEGLMFISVGRVVIQTAGIFTVLLLLSGFRDIRKYERWGIVAVFACLAGLCLTASFTWLFFITCLLVLAVLCDYALRGWKQDPILISEPSRAGKHHYLIVVVLTLLFLAVVSVWSISRVRSFRTFTYDFGLFSQMFHNMKTSGLPLTTLERDKLLSHFAVHVSPIYYLMLPFYCLLPKPETLQVLQVVVLASAVIPLWKLANHYGLPAWARVLCCGILLMYPAYSGGTSYDLHENCFLTPLILWLLYGIERRNTWLTCIAALLTLTVKEDAAVYVAVAALWLLLRALIHEEKNRWDLYAGIGILAASLTWFFAVTGYLAAFGDGVMTDRYENFMYKESSSLFTVVVAVFLHPMKALYECVESQKVGFILLTMLPLLGMPLLTRRYERYLLLIPYLLINLMSDYQYQHSIYFQYTFGSTAFLMYLLVLNLADWKLDRKQVYALLGALVVCVACFCLENLSDITSDVNEMLQNEQENAVMRKTLEQIPEDAVVTAGTCYTTALSEREKIYDMRYCSSKHLLESEYVVVDLLMSGDYSRFETEEGNGYSILWQILSEYGYSLKETAGSLAVFHKG